MTPISVIDAHGNTEYLELLGGFLGVGQDGETLAVRPEIGWGLRRQNSVVQLVHQLQAATHRLNPRAAVMAVKNLGVPAA